MAVHTHTHTQLNLTNVLRLRGLACIRDVGSQRSEVGTLILYNRVAEATLFLLSSNRVRDA